MQIELPYRFATVCQYRLWPELTANDLCHLAERLEVMQKKFFKLTGVLPEIELPVLEDLKQGRFPRPLVARVAWLLNRNRPATEPPREPGHKDVKKYKRFYGGQLTNSTFVVCFPTQPKPNRISDNRYTEITANFGSTLLYDDGFPFDSLKAKARKIGLAKDRPG